MPKHSPNDADTAAFAQLGRMTIAAGIRHIQPRLTRWLEDELQTLLLDAGVARNGVDKPVRSTKALAAAEASLGALVGANPNGKTRGRPRVNPSHSMSPVEMVDGRYTKAGIATSLGISIKSVDYFLKNSGVKTVRLPNPNGDGRSRLSTYAIADIEALAAKRDKPKVVDITLPVVTLEPESRVEKYSRVMKDYWAGKTPEQRREIMQARFAKRKDPWAKKLSENMAKGAYKPKPRKAASK